MKRLKKYLALVSYGMNYVLYVDAYVLNAESDADALVLVNARYGKRLVKSEIIPIPPTKERGVVAELGMEDAE